MSAPSERLNEIAALIDALTYGEMMRLVAEVLHAKSTRQFDESILAQALHAWAARVVAGENIELSAVPTEPSPDALQAIAALAAGPVPSADPPAKPPLPAVSLAKLKAALGLSTDELVAFFALPTSEIEAARRVGPADYLRMRAEAGAVVAEPTLAAVPVKPAAETAQFLSSITPSPAQAGVSSFSRLVQDITMQAAE
jgi:hypothetical protein